MMRRKRYIEDPFRLAKRRPARDSEKMVGTLGAARAILVELARHLDADLSIELWDGSLIPLRPNASDDIRIVVSSARALRRLMLRPAMTTIAELFATGELDVTGATPIDAMRRADHLQFRALPKNVNKARLLRSALPLLFRRETDATASNNEFANRVPGRIEDGRNDRALIHFHYDLSNDFYALLLDPEMVYSCAYFETPEASLEEAQRAKLDLICRKLRLQPGDRLFDPGCGWGGLLCHAATHYGAIAYGTTLSQEQFDFTSAKIEREGLKDRVKIELKDCRNIAQGHVFDKIAQIEMIEHVGLKNHHAFYRHLRRHLRPRGLYLGQASARRMTAQPRDFPRQTPYMKFITRYIFPGGELDHIGMTVESLERAGFEVHDVEAMREHFALTCEHWVRRLHARQTEAAAIVGWPKTRIWLLYLSLCALAFERGSLNVFQVVASNRRIGASGIPLDRAVMLRP
jgi:cyclopropane-fatty-acyl-phospholipid synthase